MKRGVRDESSLNNDTLDPSLGGVVKAVRLDVTLPSLQVGTMGRMGSFTG